MRLIYEVEEPDEHPGANQIPLWNGSHIGAYRDPAVRLIASALQIDLFKKSGALSCLPPVIMLAKSIPAPAAETELLAAWECLMEETYALILYDGLCLLCPPPLSCSVDSERRFHHASAPSLEFADGFEVYSWHGRRVPREIIMEPEKIAVARIESERNVEIRTILVERYGLSRFIADSGAQVIHQDECGTLYRKDFPLDEPLAVVMVTNSTPEPDGTHKHYFLRVPPTVATAREAVAWTFRMDPDEYAPEMET